MRSRTGLCLFAAQAKAEAEAICLHYAIQCSNPLVILQQEEFKVRRICVDAKRWAGAWQFA
jgi:hypothetical protein